MDSKSSAGNILGGASPLAAPALRRLPVPTSAGLVVVSGFAVASGMEAAVKAAFHARPHRADQGTGFVRMEASCSLDRPQEIGLVTHCRRADDCLSRHRGHGYRESHCDIPRGVKLVGRETCMREFEVACE